MNLMHKIFYIGLAVVSATVSFKIASSLDDSVKEGISNTIKFNKQTEITISGDALKKHLRSMTISEWDNFIADSCELSTNKEMCSYDSNINRRILLRCLNESLDVAGCFSSEVFKSYNGADRVRDTSYDNER
ncbi:MAG: hypothetical protein JJV93_02175 [Alphaproteobacteria bacterium]|nr:hypothetical protein [Alphaproteobacteria bacterium]MBL0718046.1 hypothetical protein [Alphaproteobacteria bacterium]